jgi:hypothetical protein
MKIPVDYFELPNRQSPEKKRERERERQRQRQKIKET